MKALTIRQPWASLIAAGVKTIETRSWSTRYRGPLAIHAGKASVLEGEVDFEDGWEFVRVGGWSVGRAGAQSEARTGMMEMYGPDGSLVDVPLGAVVATCTLADVVPIDAGLLWHGTPERLDGQPLPPENHGWLDAGPAWRWIWVADDADRPNCIVNSQERPFGDFTPGRYAWLLTDVKPIGPVPVKGRQGLWDWEAP